MLEKKPHLRKPFFLKSGTPKGKGLPKECSHCKMTGHTFDQCWKKHPHLKCKFEANSAAKGTKT